MKDPPAPSEGRQAGKIGLAVPGPSKDPYAENGAVSTENDLATIRMREADQRQILADTRVQLAEDRVLQWQEKAFDSEKARLAAEATTAEALRKLRSAKAEVRVLTKLVQEARLSSTDFERRMHEQADQGQSYLNFARAREAVLEAVYRSTSWRITAPLRGLVLTLRGSSRSAGMMSATPKSIPAQIRVDRRRRIFIEATHTYHSDLNTGIQRVVRNVLRNALALAEEYGVEVSPVICESAEFRIVEADRILADKQNLDQRGVASGSEASPRASIATRIVRRLTRMAPNTAGMGKFRGPENLDEYPSHAGHILLLLDSSWTVPIWDQVSEFRRRGGVVIGVIYDLIPVTHPHTSVPDLARLFEIWLKCHFQNTDGFIAISNTVARQLRDYAEHKGVRRILDGESKITHFHLGSELDFSSPEAVLRPEIDDAIHGDRHVFLMVGSLEPRKKHSYVLDAFDIYWRSGGNAILIICGRQAWMTEKLIQRIALHPNLGKKLFLLRDASDSELVLLYQNASALIIASEVEGFGLPIVEAFQQGLPVLCSDIPVFLEIAEGRAQFFSLKSPAALTETIRRFVSENDPSRRRDRHPTPWLTWTESTRQLMDRTIDLAKQASGR